MKIWSIATKGLPGVIRREECDFCGETLDVITICKTCTDQLIDHLKNQVPRDWLPTSTNLNALPEPIRRFIMELETNADPAGMVAENVILREQVKQLTELVAEKRMK